MYILYLDESGHKEKHMLGRNSKHYILAGIASKPEELKTAEIMLDSLRDKYFPDRIIQKPPKEFHCRELHRRGLDSPYKNIDVLDLEVKILEVVSKVNCTVFGMILDKVAHWAQYAHPWPPQIHMLEAMMNRFEWFLEKENDLGLVVHDEVNRKEKETMLSSFESYKKHGTRFKALNHVINTIFFTPSETSIFLQLDDFVAYAIFRYVEYHDSFRFNKIKSKIGEHDLRYFP